MNNSNNNNNSINSSNILGSVNASCSICDDVTTTMQSLSNSKYLKQEGNHHHDFLEDDYNYDGDEYDEDYR